MDTSQEYKRLVCNQINEDITTKITGFGVYIHSLVIRDMNITDSLMATIIDACLSLISVDITSCFYLSDSSFKWASSV